MSFLHILLLKASFKGRSRFHFLKGTIANSHNKGVWIQGDVGLFFFFFLQSTPPRPQIFISGSICISHLLHGSSLEDITTSLSPIYSNPTEAIWPPASLSPPSSPSHFHHFSPCPHHFHIQKINHDCLAPFIPLGQ